MPNPAFERDFGLFALAVRRFGIELL